MEPECKRRKVEVTVIEILKDTNWEEATENKVRTMAAERLGVDVSDVDHKRLVRRLVESFLLPSEYKVREETKEILQQEMRPNVDVKEMNFLADTYDTNFFNGGSNQDDQFEIESSDQAGQYHTQLVDILVESSQIPMGSNKKKVQRSQNFTTKEDNLLVLAWLNTSLDADHAVHAKEQKSKTYWQKMYDYFHKFKTFPSDRSNSSLMNRWSKIQLTVNNFCGCYAHIDARPESGVSELDKILQAKLMYYKTYRATFQLEHCWNDLRYQPKWLEVGQKKRPKKLELESPCAFSPSTPKNLGEDHEQGDTFVKLEKPLSRMEEKDRFKKPENKTGHDDNSIAALNRKISDVRERIYAVELKRLSLQKMQLQMEQQKMEHRIMSIDTTGLPPLQAKYYRLRQKEILDKGCGSPL